MASEILTGCRRIASFLHVRQTSVREYEQRGAPIFRDANGWMRAEKAELTAWVKKNTWTRKPVK